MKEKKYINNINKIFIILLALAFLTPIGLLTQNPTFGEWTQEEIKKMLGFVPEGIKKYADIYKFDLFDGYTVKFIHNDYIGYILSAVIGIVVIFALFYILKFVMAERK
ncbi:MULTISPECIES: PDGLE domain-containing protein [Caldicellulosiruptor]|uniref:PDGLE domain-containing protein n=1 Tax=Caldicellulosiruptor TaxID=44000 RepID=UPI00005E4C6B|nr:MULTISPECIES: PDGLE domain-containing protein [Caldicellulosiruptor]